MTVSNSETEGAEEAMTNAQPQSGWIKFLGIVCGMLLYWVLVGIGGEAISARMGYAPNVVGGMMFLLILGPTAWLAFIIVLALALSGKGFWRVCAAGAGVGAVSLAFVTASC